MHKIACSSCEQIVEVSPSSAICTECGEDLAGLIPAVGTSQHYYSRAELLIEQEDTDGALTVVKDGLENGSSSDLLLLGAILGEKVGQYDLMRHYVSRIPVDDTLRIEGEWLLRAHQARQRAQRQGRDPSQAILEQVSGDLGLPPDFGTNVERSKVAGVSDAPVEPARRRDLVSTVALLLLVALIGLGWFYSDRLLSQSWVPAAFRSEPPVEVLGPAAPSGSTATTESSDVGMGAPATELPAGSVSADEANGVDGPIAVPEDGADLQASGESALSSQAAGDENLPATETGNPDSNSTDVVVIPTPTISADVLLKQYNEESGQSSDSSGGEQPEDAAPGSAAPVNAPVDAPADDSVPDNVTDVATPEPLADASAQSIVEAVVQEPFDILKYLREFGRPDLASLPLDAQVVDDKVFVSGVVQWFEEREAVIEALSFAPGITDVNPIGLKIRTPETYTIQEGDTLWIIAFRIYGDGARWPQIYEFNADTLVSPDALGLGQVLKVPPR